MVAGAQRRSSSTVGVKGSSRKVVEPPMKVLPISVWSPSAQNASPPPPTRGDVGDDRFKVEGGKGGGLATHQCKARCQGCFVYPLRL